jgi:hypothetical protein
MNFKKISALLTVLFLFFGLMMTDASADPGSKKLVKIRYCCSIESSNPLWHILFFLFKSENREFLWIEKSNPGENGICREILLYNKRRLVADFFSRNKKVGGTVDFGGEEWRGKLNSEQAEVWFEMQKFSRMAAPGDVYRANYKAYKNNYLIFIEAKNFSDKYLYFGGNVLKKDKKFMEIKFWVIDEGEFKGQMARCWFQKTHWPPVIIEIL